MKIDIIQRFSLGSDRSCCSILIHCGKYFAKKHQNDEDGNNITLDDYNDSKEEKEMKDDDSESNGFAEPDLLILGTENGRLMVLFCHYYFEIYILDFSYSRFLDNL